MTAKPLPPPSTPGGPQLRARIVAAARTHFFATGFRRITMDDLASELAISKKTLYAHFPSKIALLQAVLLNKFEEVQTALNRLSDQEGEDFFTNVQNLLAGVQENTEEIRPPFVRDLLREAPDLFQLIQARRRTLIHGHFKELFEQGRRAGTVRTDIPPELLIEILLGATDAVANPTKVLELGITPKIAFSAILRVVLEGAITRPRSQP